MNAPETRLSLIGRLANHQDEDAWNEFVQIYQPVIFRIARRRGLQHADAAEVTQEVLGRVAGAIDRWLPDPDRTGQGTFRGWLYCVTRNLTVDWLRASNRRPYQFPSGENQSLADVIDPADEGACEFENEYRRSVFALAASRVREEFQPRTWQAFWQSTVEARDIATVARQLEMSVGAVYIARSRVMKRLANEVSKRENESVSW